MDRLDSQAAALVLRRGGVLAYPTEGVWGLGCDPFQEPAVRRLFAIKRRTPEKGLILIAGEIAQLAGLVALAGLPEARRAAVYASWPGPQTWLLPAGARVPSWITGQHDTVAVRVSAHPSVRSLCAAFGDVLVSTSANRAGAPVARQHADLDASLLAELDGVLDGETGGLGRPTPIRDARSGERLRG